MSNDLGFTPAPEYDENAGQGVPLGKGPPPGTPYGAAPPDPYGPPPAGAPYGAPPADPYGAAPGVPDYGAQPGVQPGSYIARRQSGKAIAALATGIVSFPIGFIAGPFALPLSIAAIVLAIMARKEIANDPNVDGKGLALSGLIMGIVGIVFFILFIIFIVILASVDTSTFDTSY